MADSIGTAKTAESRARGIRATGRRRKRRSRRRKALVITAWARWPASCCWAVPASASSTSSSTTTSRASTSTPALGTDRPAGRRQRLAGHPRARLRLPRRQQQAATAADDGSARSDTAMIVHVYEGHKKASVVTIPRDTLVERPDCTDSKGGKHVPGVAAGDVQHRVRGRRRRLCRQDRRVDDRHPHGPLRRGRLHRLQEAHRRARRGGDHHHQGDQRRGEPPEPRGRHAHRSTASRRSAWSAPGTASATAPTSAGSSSSRRSSRPWSKQVKDIGVLDQPDQAVRPRRHRDQDRHHRHRPRLGQDLAAFAKGLQGHQLVRT